MENALTVAKRGPMGSSGIVVDRGLEGITVGATGLTHVDGARGRLTYRGYDATALAADASFEEVCYLLLFGRLPDSFELGDLNVRLAAGRALPQNVIDWMDAMPPEARPMDVLRTCVSGLAMLTPQDADGAHTSNPRSAIGLIAKTPAIVAAWSRIRHGHAPIDPLPNLSIAANLLYTRAGKMPSAEAQRALGAYFVLLADSSFSASTFAARVTVSTRADLYAGATSALATLGGELHGGALEKVMRTIVDVERPERADPYVRAAFARGERIMGMGHRVYRTRDPRANELETIAKALGEATGKPYYAIARALEDAAARTYRERHGKEMYANVEMYSAPVLHALGFEADELTCIYACAHMVGWTAHMLEQLQDNRLIRPHAQYSGPTDATWLPLEQRGRAGASGCVTAGT